MKENINISERVTVRSLPQTAFFLLLPVEGIGLLCFIAYVAFHFQLFIAQTTALFSWLAWFAGLLAYLALGWLFVKLIRSGIDALVALAHGAADVHRKFIDNRVASARRELLHTGDSYVVFLERGQITVQSVAQEKYNYNIREVAPSAQELATTPEPASLPSPVLSMRQLLEAGIMQEAITEGRMILGYCNGELRYGSWLDLYSCGIGGVSGSGKTTTVRFLLLQALLGKAHFLMVDPHIHEPEESLAAQFSAFKHIHILPPCDETPAEVAKRIRWLKNEYTRRLAGGVKFPPLVLVLDEFNAIVRRLPDELRKELADLLLTIAQEGRKFGIFAMIIGQRWSEQDLGGKNYGAAIRSSLASTLAHRFTDEDQARKLVGSKHGPKCLELPQGHYFFRDTQGGLSEMVTPNATKEDGQYVEYLLNHAPATSWRTSGSTSRAQEPGQEPALETQRIRLLDVAQGEPDVEPDVATTEPLEPLSYQEGLVRDLLKARKGQNEIIEIVWGVKSSGGRPYREAVEEYRVILAKLAERIGA